MEHTCDLSGRGLHVFEGLATVDNFNNMWQGV
jgi:hypothetical protein